MMIFIIIAIICMFDIIVTATTAEPSHADAARQLQRQSLVSRRVFRHFYSVCAHRLFGEAESITGYASHVTRHTSHVTHHTSHITHHTSHITRHRLLSVEQRHARLCNPWLQHYNLLQVWVLFFSVFVLCLALCRLLFAVHVNSLLFAVHVNVCCLRCM